MLVCDYCKKHLEGPALSKDGKLFHDTCAAKADIKGPSAINIGSGSQIKTHTTMIQVYRYDHAKIVKVKSRLQDRGRFVSMPEAMSVIIDYYLNHNK